MFLLCFVLFLASKSLGIGKMATTFWKLEHTGWVQWSWDQTWENGISSQQREAANQPDLTHKILQSLRWAAPVSGPGRPGRGLWEVTWANRHLALSGQQKSAVYSSDTVNQGLWLECQAQLRKMEPMFAEYWAGVPIPLPQISSHKRGLTHPSGRLEDASLEKVKQFMKHLKRWSWERVPNS